MSRHSPDINSIERHNTSRRSFRNWRARKSSKLSKLFSLGKPIVLRYCISSYTIVILWMEEILHPRWCRISSIHSTSNVILRKTARTSQASQHGPMDATSESDETSSDVTSQVPQCGSGCFLPLLEEAPGHLTSLWGRNR